MHSERKATTSVFLSCPKIGHGNPSEKIALERLLRKHDRVSFVDSLEHTWSVLPASLFHTAMTHVPRVSDAYTKNPGLRNGKGVRMMAQLQREEARQKHFRIHDGVDGVGKIPAYDLGVFVQEMQLLGFSKRELHRLFGSMALAIPDVFPKDNAVQVLAARQMVRALVWSKAAAQRLEGQKINTKVVAPHILSAWMYTNETIGKTVPKRLVIKVSGSGMPLERLAEFVTVCQKAKKSGWSFELYHPCFVWTDKGVSWTVGESDEIYLSRFYRSLITHPPQILAGLPSELVGVAAEYALLGWQGTYAMFPPRGAHEKHNAIWALRHGVTLVKELDAKHLLALIRTDAVHPPRVATVKDAVGCRSPTEVLLGAK